MNTNGIGLGLCICKKICQIFGGKISVKSLLNVGSIFSIFFVLDEDYEDTIKNSKELEQDINFNPESEMVDNSNEGDN
tara:strand:+ start:1048 stop:1281 length:234 start_codon:yes stop_codon:yes gene_type:complete